MAKHKFDILLKKLDRIGIPQYEFNEFLEALKDHCSINNKSNDASMINHNNKELVKKIIEIDNNFKSQIGILEKKIITLENDNKLLQHKLTTSKNYDDDINKLIKNIKELEVNLTLNISNSLIKLKKEMQEEQQKKTRSITPISRLNLNRVKK